MIVVCGGYDSLDHQGSLKDKVMAVLKIQASYLWIPQGFQDHGDTQSCLQNDLMVYSGLKVDRIYSST